ncbi:MutS-related protein [Flagellimonas sp.]|uniref:MutS-related protein n=1 Tax=Flagellimonas sp. TaxID=2058762 RepID=UPI003B595044
MTLEPKTFYNSQLQKFEDELSDIKKKLNLSSSIRLLVFIALVLAIYFGWGNTKILVATLFLGIAAFIFLVMRHNRLKYQQDLKTELIKRNKLELRVLNRDFHDLPEGKEFLDPEHWYGPDIDLFGRGSFYQYLNRTALASGSGVLAQILQSNNIENIGRKQAAIQELAQKPEWRQEYGATATLVKTEVPANKLIGWLTDYKPFVPKQMKVWAYIFSLISSVLIACYFIDLISGYWVFFAFVAGMGITGSFVKKINKLSANTSQIQSTFTQYSRLLSLIERQEFESGLLAQKREGIINQQQSSSGILKKFSKLLDRLDQRNNILVSLVLNGFFLRDLIICSEIEIWVDQHKTNVSKWFDTIAFYDAYNSLGNYAFNHKDHVYPTIVDHGKTLECKGVAHPMLDPKKAVRNDIAIAKDEFFIVTGANMAGKSTFLRTVALQLVMANVGLPVCAQAATYSPIKLITSMRTSDSLADDESYFFSELKRLKFIVEQMDVDNYFIVLDEILKGTNSTDKAVGSQKFIKKLVSLGGTGIIATHDLSLCEVAEKLDSVSNYYFDANIVDGELFFDYQFKEGVCQNMNASFLLKKMGIVE